MPLHVTGTSALASGLEPINEASDSDASLRLNALHSSIADSACFLSIATDAAGVIQIFNAGATRMLGYSTDTVLNKITPADFSDPTELVERARQLSTEFDTPVAAGFEALVVKASRGIEDICDVTYLRKDGSRFAVLVSVTALRDAQNCIIGYLLIGIDNTARKLLTDELQRHRHHLEELVFSRSTELAVAMDGAQAPGRSKAMFLANMNHELRTPMNGMMGMIDLALRRATDSTQIDWLTKAAQSSRRLSAVISDMLDASQIEEGQLTLEQKAFSLVCMLDDIRQSLDAQAIAKGLQLSWQFEVGTPDALIGDPLRLKQILLNLVGNAIKFSEKGHIAVRVGASEDDAHSLLLSFQVADEGIGMSTEQQLRAFELFSQADESSTRKYGGSGLGLAICKRLAKLMGGDVGVTSQTGLGSKFWMTARLRLDRD